MATVLSANYELESEIGRGGMGIVYCARDKRLKREIAVKVLPPELSFRADIRQRFLREAETAAQLNHPNIVPIYTVEERENLVYFVMAYIKGDNLGQRLQQHGPIPPVEVRRILREVADALAYAHHRNVIHRDIKPDNIIIDEETGRAMVTDFGIARSHGQRRFQAYGDGDGDRHAGVHVARAVGRRSGHRWTQRSLLTRRRRLPDAVRAATIRRQQHAIDAREASVGEADTRRRALARLAAGSVARGDDVPGERIPPIASPARRRSPWHWTAVVCRLLPPGLRRRLHRKRERRPASVEITEALRDRYTPAAPTSYTPSAPTPEEMSKWNAPMVVSFRRKLAPYLAVNAILVPISLFSNHDFIAVTVIWTVALAFKYSKLWAAGYDWRDVFRQPRDRLMFDVAAETIDDARALFDEKKRAQVRARSLARAGTVLSDVSASVDAALSAVSESQCSWRRDAQSDSSGRSRSVRRFALRLGDTRSGIRPSRNSPAASQHAAG